MKRVQLEIVLGTIFVFLTSALIIIMMSEEEQRLTDFEAMQHAEQIEFGATVYEINCTGCHGTHAQGIPGLAPCLRCEEFFTTRLEDVGWDGSLEDYVVSIVTTGRQVSTRPNLFVGGGSPAMPTWSEKFGGPLRVDQISSVAAFIVNFENWAMNPNLIPTPLVDLGDTTDPIIRGRIVFGQLGCGACHTISGISAGTVGPALNGIATRGESRADDQSAEEYIHNSVLEPNAYIVEGFVENIMPQNFGDLLSDDEFDDLITFLMTLE